MTFTSVINALISSPAWPAQAISLHVDTGAAQAALRGTHNAIINIQFQCAHSIPHARNNCVTKSWGFHIQGWVYDIQSKLWFQSLLKYTVSWIVFLFSPPLGSLSKTRG